MGTETSLEEKFFA